MLGTRTWTMLSKAACAVGVTTVMLVGCGDSRGADDEASASALTDTWNHVRLDSSQGDSIAVDYRTDSDGSTISATPVWINVRSPGMKDSDSVRVVFLNYYDSASGPKGEQSSWEVDLTSADDGARFTGKLPEPVPMSESHIGYGYNFRQELAVVINGRWVKAGDDNFRFKMTWY